MYGQKHLVRCRCFLPQFRNMDDPPFHEIVVFSIVDDESVQMKYIQCPNCGIVHKVIDLCKSEIVHKEFLSSVVSIEDIKLSFDQKLIDILEKYEVNIASWEEVKFSLENEVWGTFIVLVNEDDKELGIRQGKYLKILKQGVYSIESYARDVFVSI